jgi:hypothetical protein
MLVIDKNGNTALHIGLMQVDVAANTAWNWQANAAAGKQTLDSKFTYVKNVVTKIRRARPGLAAPTALQLEDLALMQYWRCGPRSS